jgi:hypothetical protein
MPRKINIDSIVKENDDVDCPSFFLPLLQQEKERDKERFLSL